MPESDIEILEVEGSIEKIIFRNDKNGYSVFVFSCPDSDIVAVGNMPAISEGESLLLRGSIIYHENYGEQFKIDTFEKLGYKTNSDIEAYISQGFLKGLGPAMAKKIVDKFKLETLDVMKNNPEKVATIKGITLQKANLYSQILKEKENYQNLFLFLSKYEIGASTCIKVHNYYGDSSLKIIKENPYLLLESDLQIKFRLVDNIASELGVDQKDTQRIIAGVYAVLKDALLNGHTCLLLNTINKNISKLLGFEFETIDKLIDLIRGSTKFYYNEEKLQVSLIASFISEKEIAKIINKKISLEPVNKKIDKNSLMSYISSDNIIPDDEQINAILNSINNNISIITGGPGTGKTTILSLLCRYYINNNKKIKLAAPTGRAAKRMSEITQKNSNTIHRMLEFQYKSQNNEFDLIFQKNSSDPIDADIIIIDESSMIDIFLMHSLMKAVSEKTQIVLIGDVNQLPAVGPGNVFKNLIDSEKLPCVKLEKVYRQKSGGLIAVNSHNILNGKKITFEQKMQSECIYIEKNEDYDKMQAIKKLYTKILPEQYKYDIFRDVQILTPTKKGYCGTKSLNELLQDELYENVDKTEKGRFNLGDKVIVVKNNYDIEWVLKDNPKKTGKAILNGEIGFVVKVNNYTKIVTVNFDDERLVEFGSSDLDNIEPAFAITVHKSQGSEYKAVLLVLPDAPRILMHKNLLYTAFSRAKEKIFVISDSNILNYMISNERTTKRMTMLKDFLINKIN